MTPTKTTPKDFFLHLGAVVALYTAAGALINLAFSIINYFNPDQLAGNFYANSVAWPISILVVLVPILYVLEWLINRDIAKVPEKADLWIRRWRIFLTLFLVIVLVGGDLIVLINVYLNGEISSRFVYKAIVILLVGGSIGKYYFFSLYSNFKWAKMSRVANAWFGIVIVLIAIIFGFVAVGSPSKQRAIRFDNQRVNDLSNIQWQVLNYWQTKGVLPTTLDSLKDSISGNTIPTDPENKSVYVYNIKGDKKFEICATFSLKTIDTKGQGKYGGGISYSRDSIAYPHYPGSNENDTWLHEAGRTCFERTIDPERYPPRPKTI